jgi:hypothetical protein
MYKILLQVGLIGNKNNFFFPFGTISLVSLTLEKKNNSNKCFNKIRKKYVIGKREDDHDFFCS